MSNIGKEMLYFDAPNSPKILQIVEEVKGDEDVAEVDEVLTVDATVEAENDEQQLQEIKFEDTTSKEDNEKASGGADENEGSSTKSSPTRAENATNGDVGDAKDNVQGSDTSSMDAKAVRSRVFIGHLNTDRCSRRDIEKVFGKCGQIEAISVLQGYGFIQFDNEESARKAIDDIHGTPFLGMKLVVDKPAAWKRLDGENPKEPKPWPKEPKTPFVPDDDYRDRRSRDRRRRSDSDRCRDYPEVPSRFRDPYYERYLEMRYMEERLADRYRMERYYDRYPSSSSRYYSDRYDYAPLPAVRSYDRPREEEFDRRPFDRYGYR